MTIASMGSLPLWTQLLLIVGGVLLAISGGYLAGVLGRKRSAGVSEVPVGSVVAAVLGLLAFMLAFTFNMAANRFDVRKQLLLNEVNAIGTAALRAQLLPEPHRTECHDLLKRYVDGRVRVTRDVRHLDDIIAEAEVMQDELWSHAIAIARADRTSVMGKLFVESLNAMFDLHASRLTVALQYRIPMVIWFVLMVLTVLSMMGVGYQFGVRGRSSVLVQLILALSFSLVVVLIADLDDATTGLVKVSQQPMIALQQKLSAPVVPPVAPEDKP